MPEFRSVPEDDVAEFQSMVGYAFRPQEGPPEEDEVGGEEDVPEPWQVGRRYGLYDGSDLLTVCKHISFRPRIRGDHHGLHGLSAVASPPESRRQGFVREMLHGSLAESRESGVYLSALWPFKRSFYGQYGWATCSRGLAYEVDPDALAFARGHRRGEFVDVDEDDWERLDAVHDAHGAGYELTMDRTEEWWRKRVFTGWENDPYVYGYERDGDLAAYVAYSFESDDRTRTLQVRDVAFVDHDAWRALLGFFADHDSQASEVDFWTPADDRTLDLIPDTDDADAELSLGPMFRLVDVPDALEALSYPEDADADLVLDVSDPLADWNDDTYRFAVSNGDASVERVDADADAELGVGALSQLYVGYRSASALARVGDLDADGETVRALAASFPERATFLREGF